MEPAHSSSIGLFYVGTFILNQDQQLKLNIHVKSVRRMFAQIRTPSYVLIAKPGHMQNVLDSPIHNLIITWAILRSTGFVTGAACHLQTALIKSSMLYTTHQMNSKYPPLFTIKKENMQIFEEESHGRCTFKDNYIKTKGLQKTFIVAFEHKQHTK